MASKDPELLKINSRPMFDDSDDEKDTDEKHTDNDQSTSTQKTAPATAPAKAPKKKRYELGYWKIQGLASPARMMLKFAGVDFENKMYEAKPVKDGDKPNVEFGGYSLDDWYNVKAKKGLDFPNLPHWIDHKTGFKLTQAKSIYRYIASEFKIGVQTNPNLAIADMMVEMIGQVMGVENPLTRSAPFIFLSYDGFGSEKDKDGNAIDFEIKRKAYLENMAKPESAVGGCFKQIEGFMQNKHFVTGDEISYADFCLYYLCVTHERLDYAFATRFPNLDAFRQRMSELEGMKEWHESDMAKLDFNNKMAKFK